MNSFFDVPVFGTIFGCFATGWLESFCGFIKKISI